MAEISYGHGSMLKLSELKNVVWGFGVLKSGGYFVLVHVFIEGFRFISDVAWIGRKNLFYWACVLVLNRGLSTNLQDFFCLDILYFCALILCIVYFTECMY